MSKKKKIILGSLAGLLVTVIGCAVFYVVSGSNIRKSHTLDYLYERGYFESEISSVQVRHSFLNRIIGYNQWAIFVEFEDEPGIIYEYSFDNKLITITQTGFTGGDPKTDKDDLIASLKHLER